MPIHCPLQVRNLDKEEFDERDRIVMRCAYDSQNALGRLCDERVYEKDLARRLRAIGFRDIYTQVPIQVTHRNFSKTYRLDLVADNALYELKTVLSLVMEHDAQVLNYALLVAVSHGKLLNFRNPRVEGRLRFNAISEEIRRSVEFEEVRWRSVSSRCEELKQWSQELMVEWGGFLDFRLYEEALVFYFGGPDRATCLAQLHIDGEAIGTHRFNFHASRTCFVVTGFADPLQQASHVARLFSLSEFKAMQWVNFHHNKVRFETFIK